MHYIVTKRAPVGGDNINATKKKKKKSVSPEKPERRSDNINATKKDKILVFHLKSEKDEDPSWFCHFHSPM